MPRFNSALFDRFSADEAYVEAYIHQRNADYYKLRDEMVWKMTYSGPGLHIMNCKLYGMSICVESTGYTHVMFDPENSSKTVDFDNFDHLMAYLLAQFW